ncbi:Kunitz/Bovine pancreatic trypsin inhibitor domain protein [Ditylenchus destructor]|uniref:Kunitz/Bovine pancreatic trypsin inhibitor domain protein n=1 Tax=Ditylenchus destructor TaxID=166010 RepID=A0AAD4MUU3_9BILA|nr:Kunitz/Bovine pancreatic trypsin inhibitor domain protein [Ditylenchus destructor]
MNYMLLVNVLEYFGREKLEKLSIVSRLFEKVVRIEFPRHPFRVFEELHIVTGTNGGIGFGMSQYGISLKITSITPPEANVVEFKSGSTGVQRWPSDAMKYYSIGVVSPFIKSVRFEKTIIELNVTLLNPQSITLLENLSYLWTGQTLELRHGYDDEVELCSSLPPNKSLIPNCDSIFNTPGIIARCRELNIYRIDTPLCYSTLYSLKTIRIWEVHGFSAANLLNFLEGLSEYNSSTLLICFTRVDFMRTHIGIIRQKIKFQFSVFFVGQQGCDTDAQCQQRTNGTRCYKNYCACQEGRLIHESKCVLQCPEGFLNIAGRCHELTTIVFMDSVEERRNGILGGYCKDTVVREDQCEVESAYCNERSIMCQCKPGFELHIGDVGDKEDKGSCKRVEDSKFPHDSSKDAEKRLLDEAFSKAKVTHAWKLFIVDRQLANGKLTKFRDENMLTKDVLELRVTDSQGRRDLRDSENGNYFKGFFHYRNLWILERKPL